MLFKTSLSSLLLLCFGFAAPVAAAPKLAAKDLAIALPITAKDLLAGTALFPREWHQSLHRAFAETNVGSALETESPLQDWRLVSLRIAPCAPLGHTPADAETNCAPEVRLVWQPILRKVRLHERYMEAAADDRAVHAIYPVDAKDLHPLMADVLELRDPKIPESAYQGVGIRPEANDDAQRSAFLKRLQIFLGRYAKPAQLQTLTAFSLPEGREPAHLDEWVFLAFRGKAGKLEQDSILIRSAVDGRVLADLGPAISGTQSQDAEALYALLDGSADAKELAKTVMLRANDIARLTPAVRDRRQLLVANTSCISCHKMNALRFDFHNFGYLEDRDLTISPRVVRDVELDLQWLGKVGL